MTDKITNATAYPNLSAPIYKKVKVQFEIALDAVPGWGDNIEDHIKLMFDRNPYALTATVIE